MTKLVEVALSPGIDLPLCADSQSMSETCTCCPKQHLSTDSLKNIQVIFALMTMEAVMARPIHLSLVGDDDCEAVAGCHLAYWKVYWHFCELCGILEMG